MLLEGSWLMHKHTQTHPLSEGNSATFVTDFGLLPSYRRYFARRHDSIGLCRCDQRERSGREVPATGGTVVSPWKEGLHLNSTIKNTRVLVSIFLLGG